MSHELSAEQAKAANDEAELSRQEHALWLSAQQANVRNIQPVIRPEETPHYHEPAADSPLRRWWTDQAFDEADRTIAKMEEYGSMDLVHIGHGLWDVMGRTTPLSDAAAMELGCLFYTYGKIQRALSAVKHDRPILDDTWFDMHIYAKMAQAARAGVWPL